MDPAFRERLERVYADHPLTADAVLRRVKREHATLDRLTARHLAETSIGGPTDQNHTGGADATRALAAAVGLAPGWLVLDVGTGLGGTPRLLAEEYGCRCHGVELTAARFNDAERLTRMVGLDDRVTFTLGDFMEIDLPGSAFDLAVCQGAIMHFPDLRATLRRLASCLRPGGRLAIDEMIVATHPSRSDIQTVFRRLLSCWNGRFDSREEWLLALRDTGYHLDSLDDMTPVAVRDLEFLSGANQDTFFNHVTEDERAGWELGLELLRSGHLASVRILATTSPPASDTSCS